MPDGEWIRELLESVGFGLGASHLAANEPCPRCHGRRQVGHPELPLPCPECCGVVG